MSAKPLTALLPMLASCLQSHSSCENFKGGTFTDEATFGISQDELDAAIGDDGELTETGCAALCEDRHGYAPAIVSIDSCALADEGATTTTGAGDTGAVAVAAVHCAWTENAICEGRAHEAVTSRPEGSGPDPVAAWLARAGHAEASSVKAFVSLATELERLGAPADLVDRARAAARDEVRHARILGRIAGARGGITPRPTFAPTPDRPAVALAVENVVEGCVRETWAAMVAHHQAVAAADPEVRAAFAAIAVDEARHGELAFAVDAWLDTRLSAAEREEVAAARSEAVSRLIASLDEPDPALALAAGLPSEDRARALAFALRSEVWEA